MANGRRGGWDNSRKTRQTMSHQQLRIRLSLTITCFSGVGEDGMRVLTFLVMEYFKIKAFIALIDSAFTDT